MSEPERSIFILPSAIRLRGAFSGSMKEEAKVAHSTRLLHVGGPSAPISQLVASTRRGGTDKAEDWGARRVLLEDKEHNRRLIRPE